ncbi:MAG: hypothetical protein LUH48_09250 [Clostridiales bacterium]|nr:hypothetical protein [Clostridiales bacterium]
MDFTDWQRMAEKELRAYNRRKNGQRSLERQISQLREDAENIRSATSDGTPVSGGTSGREDFLLNNIVLRSELERNLRATQQWCRNMDDALHSLSEEDQLALDRFYINRHRGHVERLGEELGLEKTAVYNRVNAALLRFVQAYYGCASL